MANADSLIRTQESSMLALGMITARRDGLDVHQSIGELRRAGFSEALHLFCEPNSPPVNSLPGLVVHRNSTTLGNVGNWAHCLRFLVEQSNADYFLLSEDDVTYAIGARAALNAGLEEYQDFGYLSLYTPTHEAQWMGEARGWIKLDRPRDIWGTQSMCFTRNSALRLLDCKRLREDDQCRGPTDYIVMECLRGLPCYYHRPSLANHTGKISTIGHNWYDDHVGFEFDPEFRPR